MKPIRMLSIVVGLLALAAVVVVRPHQARAQGNLPWVGVWKLNLEKSRGTGTPPRSVTRTYQQFEGSGLKYLSETVRADGTRAMVEYRSHLDGRDVPWTGTPTPVPNTIAETRVDANSFAFVLKKDGQVTSRGVNVVTQDGRTLTVIAVPASGQPGGWQVYDKQ